SKTDTKTITVTITDLNDQTPVYQAADGDDAISVAENTGVDTSIDDGTITDSDTGNSFTCTLGGADSGDFDCDISGTTVSIEFKAVPNYESAADADTNNVYIVTVLIHDGAANDANGATTLTITVTDADEFDVSSASDADSDANSLAENSAAGTAAQVTALATDSDGTTNTVTYTMQSQTCASVFGVHSTTGVVTVSDNSNLNAESATSCNVVIRSTSTDGSTSDTTFTITVTDADETDIGSTTDTNSAADTVAENAADNAAVGITASASDADVDDDTTYSMAIDTSACAGWFDIGSSDGIVRVDGSGEIDYETVTSCAVTITSTSDDNSASTLSDTIAITDANDQAPTFTGVDLTPSSAEMASGAFETYTIVDTDTSGTYG
ncbi:uncharacterized protein METZ01_LOCUS302617, partial [marine metagenome]